MEIRDRSTLYCGGEEAEPKQCKCLNKSICLEIYNLLKDGHRPEAEELLEKI